MDTIGALTGKIGQAEAPMPSQTLQGANAPTPRMNVKETAMQHQQRILILEQRVGDLTSAIERLTHLLQDQMGLEL